MEEYNRSKQGSGCGSKKILIQPVLSDRSVQAHTSIKLRVPAIRHHLLGPPCRFDTHFISPVQPSAIHPIGLALYTSLSRDNGYHRRKWRLGPVAIVVAHNRALRTVEPKQEHVCLFVWAGRQSEGECNFKWKPS